MDNSSVKAEALYTTPQQVYNKLVLVQAPTPNRFIFDLHNQSCFNSPLQVYKVHQALSPISPMFSIAAAFGNVHGVYKVWQKLLLFYFHLSNSIKSFSLMLSQSGRQCGLVPQVVERAPRLCQGAAEVLRGQASLPGHARRQWVLGWWDRGSCKQTTDLYLVFLYTFFFF